MILEGTYLDDLETQFALYESEYNECLAEATKQRNLVSSVKIRTPRAKKLYDDTQKLKKQIKANPNKVKDPNGKLKKLNSNEQEIKYWSLRADSLDHQNDVHHLHHDD
jgi:SMC interacting uncharacterized protein involved in chromosome segregation